jgi:hypothetical protein
MTEEFTTIVTVLGDLITEIEDPRGEGGGRAKEGTSRETFGWPK